MIQFKIFKIKLCENYSIFGCTETVKNIWRNKSITTDNDFVKSESNLGWEFKQGSKGIRQWPIYIDVHPHGDTQNYPFCKLQLVVETFGDSTQKKQLIKIHLKSSKLLSQQIRKRY